MTELQVRLDGSGPYGFRLFGGNYDALVISKIRPGSKASESVLKEGDVVVAFNSQSCAGLTPAQAMGLVDNAGSFLDLTVKRAQIDSNSHPEFNSFSSNSIVSSSDISRNFFENPGLSVNGYNGCPVNGHDCVTGEKDYTRRQETQIDDNTTRRTTVETERYGGTTLTRITNESYSNWNDVQDPVVRSSPRPQGSTTSGLLLQQAAPTNSRGHQVTFDLGPSDSNNFRNNANASPFSGNSAACMQKNSNIRAPSGFLQANESISNDNKSFNDCEAFYEPQPKISPLSFNRSNVWTPAKPESTSITYDLGGSDVKNTVDFTVSYSPFQSATFPRRHDNLRTVARHEPSTNIRMDPYLAPTVEVKENLDPVMIPSGPLNRSPLSRSPLNRSPLNRSPMQWNSMSSNNLSSLSADRELTPLKSAPHITDSVQSKPLQCNSMFNVSKNTWQTDATVWKPFNLSSTTSKTGQDVTDFSTKNNDLFKSPANESFKRPSNESFNRPANESFNRPANESFNRPANESFNRPPSRQRVSKFDSDLGYVDPFAQNDLNKTSDTSRPMWQGSRDQSSFPDLPPSINKILSDPSQSDSDFPFRQQRMTEGGPAQHSDKKVFVDSAFYSDPKHLYPTVEEQVKMARVVAMSLTSDANATARGHQMFLKRRERADQFTIDSSANDPHPLHPVPKPSNVDSDLHYNPTPWNPVKNWTPMKSDVHYDAIIPPPPPLPTSLLFVPKDEQKSAALSAEEFERVRLYSQKTKHNTVSPQVCFNIARDLRENKGKGGRMFAKRQARSEQWIVEGVGRGPDPEVMMKIAGGFSQDAAKNAVQDSSINEAYTDDIDYTKAPTVNRLQAMIDLPKAKMTPWDAVADYGDVELAFEHLKDYQFMVKNPGTAPRTDSLSKSLQHLTGPQVMDGYQITKSPVPPPGRPAAPGLASAGTPAWAQSNSVLNSDFSVKQSGVNQFTNRVDFSSRSSGGYKPVSFLLNGNQTSFTAGGGRRGSSIRFSEF